MSTESVTRMLEREKRNIMSYSKFVKIPSGGYLDLEFQTKERNSVITGPRVFHGEATGSYSTKFKVVQLDCDNTAIREWEIGRTLALPIIERLAQGRNKLRVHRRGSGTSTEYIPEILD